MKCDICKEELVPEYKQLPPKKGRGKIKIKNSYRFTRNYKFFNWKTPKDPKGISYSPTPYRKRGRDERPYSQIRGAGTGVMVNGGMRYDYYRTEWAWDGESYICPNIGTDEHNILETRLKARKGMNYFYARKKGLLLDD